MTCPRCLESTLRKFVDVTLCIPGDMTAISKTNIRSKSVEIVAANWEKARWYCPNCGWHMRTDSEIVDMTYESEAK
jgi:ribosomal protein S27AE